MQVTVDGYTRIVLTAITVLLTVLTVGLWYESPSTLESAQAKIPDQGMQLQVMIDLQTQTNQQLAQIQAALLSGNVKVQVVEKNKSKGTGGAGSAGQR